MSTDSSAFRQRRPPATSGAQKVQSVFSIIVASTAETWYSPPSPSDGMPTFDDYRYIVLRDVDDKSASGTQRRKGYSISRRRQFLLLTTIVVILTIIGIYRVPLIESIAGELGYHENVYAVIIDAGSTGSRVLAYTFHRTYLGKDIVLDDELFVESKPGLSSFATAPKKGEESITKLLEKAYTVVPKEKRSETPVMLRATAGLRLLEPAVAEMLLDAARTAVLNSGFKVGPDAVEIMDGADEGICAWYTVNLLQDRLTGKRSGAAFDLGGGSTQVTYEIKDGNERPTRVLPGPEGNVSLFTHSYLNMGLMAMRRQVLLTENAPNATQVTSQCINSIVQNLKWRYSNVDYTISGPQTDIAYLNVKETASSVSEKIPIVRYNLCRSKMSNIVKDIMINSPQLSDLNKHWANVFSYYFDIAGDAGLIDPFIGGVVRVKEFTEASKKVCNMANVDQPWACFDLTYISVLLEEAFELEPTKKVSCVKKINGHEISWALGLAYNNIIKNL